MGHFNWYLFESMRLLVGRPLSLCAWELFFPLAIIIPLVDLSPIEV